LPRAPIGFGMRMFRRFAESPLYVLHLVPPPERGTLGVGVAARPYDDTSLAPTLAHARVRNFAARPLQFMSRSPADDIRDVARAKGASLIVMGWHKPVWSRTVLGGTVQAVMRESAAEVVVLIDRGLAWPPGRILVPYAGTVQDRSALGLATRLAAECPSSLLVVRGTKDLATAKR